MSWHLMSYFDMFFGQKRCQIPWKCHDILMEFHRIFMRKRHPRKMQRECHEIPMSFNGIKDFGSYWWYFYGKIHFISLACVGAKIIRWEILGKNNVWFLKDTKCGVSLITESYGMSLECQWHLMSHFDIFFGRKRRQNSMKMSWHFDGIQ